MKKIGIHGAPGKKVGVGWGRVGVVDNPNSICLGPGPETRYFCSSPLNQLGILFIVNLQCVLATMGTE